MQNKNMSDIIEAYIKSVLQENQRIEIQRKQIADHFDCVPSQINYVIKTRFTPENGYAVESKRGGGGYIRIMKLAIVDDSEIIDAMLSVIDDTVTLRNAIAIINNLAANDVINQREAEIMFSAIDKDALGKFINAPEVRAVILKNMLLKLKYQETK
ncbi:CtsR family transcriptional regulator [Aerococcus suis]|uniref:Transcriptional regulator CtsR n=1 Tax=Aerococcus suis TaxID=371602 RepID=A0A1W1YWG3_9LACT|nr:CtsR family transcriptional regulator [Aerococcus suis]MCI7240622.1 CtsR family transcriptional regulator [Aerococcus suis]MDD7759151.1 CtsR family transcriptional regulator [Aerococcus suis]MDY4646505.1 CtsR family transcriptional regulator [Aerococcus suis]SMC40048.1 transcriptional regulator CtsR [Aerococcus suis]